MRHSNVGGSLCSEILTLQAYCLTIVMSFRSLSIGYETIRKRYNPQPGIPLQDKCLVPNT